MGGGFCFFFFFSCLQNLSQTRLKGRVLFRGNVEFSLKCLPRSEHWTTRRWHWHLKGHFGSGGIIGSSSLAPGGAATLSGRSPDPASSSIMKSRKPDWRKGRAQQAVTRSRERQADLMVLPAGKPGGQEDTVQRPGRFTVCD